jgi:hypothetical protein
MRVHPDVTWGDPSQVHDAFVLCEGRVRKIMQLKRIVKDKPPPARAE